VVSRSLFASDTSVALALMTYIYNNMTN